MRLRASIHGLIRGLYERQSAQGLAEYGLILVLISIVAIVVMQLIGNSANTLFRPPATA